MAKVALITDTHWGVRGDSVAFHDASRDFMRHVFFPSLIDKSVEHVIHLGDLVDRRRYLNTLTARRLREDFLDPLHETGIPVDMIAGNHDTFFKTTNEVNTLAEIVAGKYPFRVHDMRPTTLDICGMQTLMLPWVCDENRTASIAAINDPRARVVMGHLELKGFEMYRGSVCEHGEDPVSFARFDLVCSGHYHHRSSRDNIRYLGSHGEFTWSDYEDPRGFHVLDTETLELEFIRNPFSMFRKIWYDDAGREMRDVVGHEEVDYDQYAGCMLKVVVKSKENPYWFDTFIDRLEKAGPIDIQVVEDHMNLDLELSDDVIDEAESTLDMFRGYVASLKVEGVDMKRLDRLISELYTEAMTVE